jgi:hypothetical protein
MDEDKVVVVNKDRWWPAKAASDVALTVALSTHSERKKTMALL